MAKTLKPVFGELANDEETILRAAGAFTAALVPNQDTILRTRGGNLEVYRQLLKDDQVASTWQQRQLAVVSKEWDVEPGGNSAQDKAAAEFLKEQLDAIKWDKATAKMLFTAFYGYGVAEMMWGRDGRYITIDQIKVRQADRFRFGTDGGLYLLTMRRPQGERMPERKFWTATSGSEHDDQPYGIGLAHALYWPVFFKRGGVKFWAIFLEKFAQPTAKATMPPGAISDPEAKRLAMEALEAIQADSGVLVPDNLTIELIEAARSGTADYETMKRAMDAAIAKVVLSQTMTTDNGSSRSQAEVHKDVRDEVVKSDADLICESFNQGPVAWLTEWNFPGAKPPRVWRNTEPPEDLNSLAERDSKLSSMGFEPTEDYMRETYGEGWVKKQSAPIAPGLPGGDALGPEFAELGALTNRRLQHRADQQSIVDGARRLASDYEDLVGERVAEILSYLEETDDVETFKERLTELAAEAPKEQAVDKIHRGGFFARLLGAMRQQR